MMLLSPTTPGQRSDALLFVIELSRIEATVVVGLSCISCAPGIWLHITRAAGARCSPEIGSSYRSCLSRSAANLGILIGLCRRRGWRDPTYECYRDSSGYTCLVLVNGREYQTDLAYESDGLAQENAAMRAFMVCRNFSVNGGMLARNGIVQGLPATADTGKHSRSKKSRHHSSSSGHRSHGSHRSGHHSSSSSTASFE